MSTFLWHVQDTEDFSTFQYVIEDDAFANAHFRVDTIGKEGIHRYIQRVGSICKDANSKENSYNQNGERAVKVDNFLSGSSNTHS